MPTASHLKYAYLAYFSQPVADRSLYGLIRKRRPRRILELGVGSGLRAQRMLSVATRYQPVSELRYAGVDLFEARPNAALSLKQAHCLLKGTGVRVQLVPGDPYSALARMANSLRDNDLLLISADQDADSLERSWFFFPRMLHADSLVLREVAVADRGTVWQPIAMTDVASWAANQQSLRRVA